MSKMPPPPPRLSSRSMPPPPPRLPSRSMPPPPPRFPSRSMPPPPPRSMPPRIRRIMSSPTKSSKKKPRINAKNFTTDWVKSLDKSKISTWNIDDFKSNILNILEMSKEHQYTLIEHVLSKVNSIRQLKALTSACKHSIINIIIMQKNDNILWLILQKIPDIRSEMIIGGAPPLFMAMEQNYLFGVKSLCFKDFSQNLLLQNSIGQNIFEVAIRSSFEIFTFIFDKLCGFYSDLIQRTPNILLTNTMGQLVTHRSWLNLAIHSKNTEIVKKMLSWTLSKMSPWRTKISLNHIDYRRNFLIESIRSNSILMVKLLIQFVEWPLQFVEYATVQSFYITSSPHLVIFLCDNNKPFIQKWLYITRTGRNRERAVYDNNNIYTDIISGSPLICTVLNKITPSFQVLFEYILKTYEIPEAWINDGGYTDVVHVPNTRVYRRLFDQTLLLRRGVLLGGMNYTEIRLLYMYLRRIRVLKLPDVKNGSSMPNYCKLYREYVLKIGLNQNKSDSYKRTMLLWLWKLYCDRHGQIFIALPFDTDIDLMFFHVCALQGPNEMLFPLGGLSRSLKTLSKRNSSKSILKF